MKVNFFQEGISYNYPYKSIIKNVFKKIANCEAAEIEEVSIIFIARFLQKEYNKKYLNHNYNTDVITFNYSNNSLINGEIYIDIETVKDNAKTYSNNDLLNELNRIIIHGFLHLIGYTDETKKKKGIMTAKENKYLGYINV